VQTFTLRFAPLEVDDFAYSLAAVIPSLPAETQPLELSVRGRATRPLCHFDVDVSPDYLAQRTTLCLRNEHGVMGAPIEATGVRVCELTSRGSRMRNPVNFYAVNPTNTSYEFVWEVLGQVRTGLQASGQTRSSYRVC
jgi:hypothetical protein